MKFARLGRRFPDLIILAAASVGCFAIIFGTMRSASAFSSRAWRSEARRPLAPVSRVLIQTPGERMVETRAREFISDVAQEMGFTLEGKITEQAAGRLTVSTEQNIVFHVTYDDKTEITRDDGGRASAQDLRVGAQVKVDGDLAESGEIKARKIVVEKSQKTATRRIALRTPLMELYPGTEPIVHESDHST